jgi:uroporphyrinogen decarboxylase
MESRERVLCALEGREPDRVPLDLGATPVTGIHRDVYKRLLQHIGHLPDAGTHIVDPLQQLAGIDDVVRQHLEVDVVGIGGRDPRFWKYRINETPDGYVYSDAWGIQREMKQDGLYFDKVRHPLGDLQSVSDLAAFKLPSPDAFLRTVELANAVESAQERNEAVLLILGGETLGKAVLSVGFSRFYTLLAAQPAVACALMDIFVDCKIALWEAALSAIKTVPDIVAEEDDFGSQDRLLLSPGMYRKHIKPRQKRLYSFIKANAPGARLFLHSDGAIRPIIPDLIEMGVDILNPVQTDASGMDPLELKREFGSELSFWGAGVRNTLLTGGTPESVADETRRSIESLAPGGGFVFSTIHNIQPEVPIENAMAMWNALHEYGVYQSRSSGTVLARTKGSI